MNLVALKSHIGKLESTVNEDWRSSLNMRKRKELEFHDVKRNQPEVEKLDRETFNKRHGNKKYYGGTGISNDYIDAWVAAHTKGKVYLDYGCGNGECAIRAAKLGAALSIGIDISPVSVENSRRFAREAGVADNIHFLQADAENTRLPDGSIDVVLCSGVLHHMDLSYVFPELRRILSPGGRIMAKEALDYNPAIKLYRRLTPEMRTEWEAGHIIDLSDVRFASRFFTLGEVRYWHITSVLYPYLKPLLPVMNALDGVLTHVPFVQLMSWMITFELIKQEV